MLFQPVEGFLVAIFEAIQALHIEAPPPKLRKYFVVKLVAEIEHARGIMPVIVVHRRSQVAHRLHSKIIYGWLFSPLSFLTDMCHRESVTSSSESTFGQQNRPVYTNTGTKVKLQAPDKNWEAFEITTPPKQLYYAFLPNQKQLEITEWF